MEHDIETLQTDLKGHIKKHDEDYTKLLWWVISILVIIVGAVASFYMQYGALNNRVSQVEEKQKDFVSNVQLAGAIALFDEKLKNISENVNDIKQGLNIK